MEKGMRSIGKECRKIPKVGRGKKIKNMERTGDYERLHVRNR